MKILQINRESSGSYLTIYPETPEEEQEITQLHIELYDFLKNRKPEANKGLLHHIEQETGPVTYNGTYTKEDVAKWITDIENQKPPQI